MMFQNFWDMVLDPVFLVMFGLVLAAFIPLLLSVWVTWVDNDSEEE